MIDAFIPCGTALKWAEASDTLVDALASAKVKPEAVLENLRFLEDQAEHIKERAREARIRIFGNMHRGRSQR